MHYTPYYHQWQTPVYYGWQPYGYYVPSHYHTSEQFQQRNGKLRTTDQGRLLLTLMKRQKQKQYVPHCFMDGNTFTSDANES